MKATAMTVSAVLVLSSFAVSARAADKPSPPEKVLFGFEPDDVDRAVQNKGTGLYPPEVSKVLDNGEILFFIVPTPGSSHDREMKALRPMRCVPDKASAGKYSCKVAELLDSQLANSPTFRLPPVNTWPLYAATAQFNPHLPELLNTTGWFGWAFPRDWSGYDLLRVDVCVETADQVGKLMLEVEDDLVEPPVSVTYEAPPAGKWVTLEMDLNQAAAERKLDVARMQNIWVRVVLKELQKSTLRMRALLNAGEKDELAKLGFLAYVDNIRLARKGAPCAYPLPKGTRSAYQAELPRVYAAEEHMLRWTWPRPAAAPVPTTAPAATTAPEPQVFPFLNLSQRPRIVPADTRMPAPAAIKPAPAPTRLAPPAAAPIQDMLAKGCLDDKPANTNIYNSVRLTCAAAFDPQHVAVGFYIFQLGSFKAGPTAEVPLARLCTAAIRTADGGQTWKGLDGTDWPTVMGGNISKVPPRQVDLGGDVMGMAQFGCSAMGGQHVGYPADRMFFVRSVFTGDSWWKSPKYFVSGEPRHCHNVGSGDVVATPSGRLWAIWCGRNRASYGHIYESRFATNAYYSDDGGVTWCSWRGPGLVGRLPDLSRGQIRLVPYRGQVAALGANLWSRFDGKQWSEPEPTGVAVFDAVARGEDIYLSDATGPVKWFDGKSWQDFSAPGRTGARGKIGVCDAKTAVFIEPDKTGKKLLCWTNKAGGDWKGPTELVSENTPIAQVAVQRYAPAGFMPVAYMCVADEQLPVHNPKQTYDIIYGFNQYPPAGTVHQPWIKLLNVPVGP